MIVYTGEKMLELSNGYIRKKNETYNEIGGCEEKVC